MKEFVKVLRHYADFNGRARRKEYWMFMLFNCIFAFAWTVIMLIVFAIFRNDAISDPGFGYFAYMNYGIVMMLPSLALVVRRLHDTGKSGWMILVSLIPLIGGIWLLALMLINGQSGDNKYGNDPKTSPEIFSDRSKLKSAGIALTVAASSTLIVHVFTWIVPAILNGNLFISPALVLIGQIFHFAAIFLLLIAGLYLLKEKSISEIREKKKNTIGLLLAATVIMLLLNIESLISNMYPFGFFNSLICFLYTLSLVLFAASVLFSNSNELIRKTATAAIIFSGIYLLSDVYFYMTLYSSESSKLVDQLQDLLAMFNILTPVAFIVLTGTFLSKEQKQADTVKAPSPSPEPPAKPERRVETQTATSFPRYTGSGVCDVCNCSLSDKTAYIVPNAVFYNSKKYRDYVSNSVMARITGMPVNDAYFAQMQAQDKSAGSAVCESCINMFK